MSRQHTAPYLVTKGASQQLNLDHRAFNEAWLQNFIFKHSEALPIDELEPAFGPLIPVCRELRTNAGSLDILFANAEGLLTLVECKLWKNPEARRAVLGQILDYAKELSLWSYEDLDKKIKNARKESLYQLVNRLEDIDESEFIDNVKRNLSRGRFLLLVVGGGIREGVERLTDFLQKHTHLNFTLALVEVAIFKIPKQPVGGHLVLPRVVAQTVEVERAVLRIEEGKIVVEPPDEEDTGPVKRTKISEEAFYEELAKFDPQTSMGLRKFLNNAKGRGLSVDPGQNSLMLKFFYEDLELNLGIFRINGNFENKRIAAYTERIGYSEIGEDYLTELATIFKGSVYKHPNKWLWSVRKKGNKENFRIADCLAPQVQTKWLALIQKTTNRLVKAVESGGVT